PRIREEALEAIGDHPEIGDSVRMVMASALASKQAGVVTTAADLIKAHPDRVLTISAKARADSLDPNSPPPKVGSAPARELDPDVAKSLSGALGQAWAEDLIETRIALIDAAVAVDLPGAHEAATTACRDANVTLRDAGKKALAALGQPYAACAPPDPPPPAAPEIDSPMPHTTKLTFASSVGLLTIHLDPILAPIATARIIGLAQAGFFKGILVHRVVPGFVAQFGDPEGDGFGGSGHLLRCETSPVPFNPLDVGIALAGRDTGSSQLFVTLSRTPHLDGEYTHLGHAEGDWAALVEGDAIGDAKIEDE
ncbi:MAG: peptidylprolyl isomerase, partial [Polyangiaceae bacterium]